MSLQWKPRCVEIGVHRILPSFERRRSWRFVIDTTNSDPSGIQPTPTAGRRFRTRCADRPAADTDFTAA
jgi:hypothetical protein